MHHPLAALYRARAVANMGMGCMMHSDYTGQLCQETGTRMAAEGMSHCDMPLSGQDVVSWATCDVSPLSRTVISSCFPNLRPQHLFKSVASHLSSGLVRKVIEHTPPPIKKKALKLSRNTADSTALIAQTEAAYAKQLAFIIENKGCLYSRARKSECLLHGGHCYMTWQRSAGQRLLSWNQSGPVCVAHTTYGCKLGLADPTTEAWSEWGVAMAVSDHDVVTCENSDTMKDHFTDIMVKGSAEPPSELAQPSKWFVVGFMQNSTDHGFPSRRRRSWRNAINQDRMLWLGPRNARDVQLHFNSLFRRSVELDADCWLTSSESDRSAYISELARSRGNFFRDGEAVDLKATMSALSWQRFLGFKAEFERQKAFGFSGAIVGDCFQNISARKRVGSVMLSVTISSTMYSFSSGCLFTPDEIQFSQGWPLPSDPLFGHLLPFDRAALGHSAERQLMGNGMHLCQVAANFLHLAVVFCTAL